MEKLRDGLRFFRWNLQHYSLAVWGLRLRFDPPYPYVKKFFPQFLNEPVLEYRTYGVHALWAGVLAAWLPLPVLVALVIGWACISYDRSHYLKTNLSFWRQVLKENGVTHPRAHGRCVEHLVREMERAMKAGKPWKELAMEATELQEGVIRHQGPKSVPRVNLDGR